MDFREVVGRKTLKALTAKLLSVGGRKFLGLPKTQHPSLFTNLTSLIPHRAENISDGSCGDITFQIALFNFLEEGDSAEPTLRERDFDKGFLFQE
jgi:hypothetical protein